MAQKAKLQEIRPEVLDRTARGEPAPSIAAAVGVPVDVIWQLQRDAGIRHKKGQYHLIQLDKDDLQARLLTGRTQSQIARDLGVSLNTIERRVRMWGLRTQRTGPRLGQGHLHCWEGGRRIDKHGYVEVYVPKHPQARLHSGSVLEHRLLMEVMLGRYLSPTEVVHHEDEHPRHNRPDNLRLFASNGDHLRHELTGRTKATRRSSIPGAYRCNQTIDRCPDEHETLAGTPSNTLHRLRHHIEIHRPTTEQQTMAFREVVRSGPHRPPFQWMSTD